jgi:hypothetical protein
MTYSIEVFKRTEDDWCPSYESDAGPLVMVSLGQFDDGETWFVTVNGDDDSGMVKEFLREHDALTHIQQVIGLEYVNRPHLQALGFVSV